MKTTILILGIILSHFQPQLQGLTTYKATADLSKKTRYIDFASVSAFDSLYIRIHKNTLVFQDLDLLTIRKIKKGYEIVKSNGQISDIVRLQDIRAKEAVTNPNTLKILIKRFNQIKVCNGKGEVIAEASSVKKGRWLQLTVEIADDRYRKEMISFATIHLITQNRIRNDSNPAIYYY